MSDVKGKSTSGRGLTPKQEKFCQLYIELGNASEAYRQAYDVGDMTNGSISVNASKLLNNNTKIALRVEELRQAHQQRHNLTVGANKALELLGKHLGMFKDRVDVTSGGNALPAVINISFSDEPEEP